jgi:hypothetical protein
VVIGGLQTLVEASGAVLKPQDQVRSAYICPYRTVELEVGESSAVADLGQPQNEQTQHTHDDVASAVPRASDTVVISEEPQLVVQKTEACFQIDHSNTKGLDTGGNVDSGMLNTANMIDRHQSENQIRANIDAQSQVPAQTAEVAALLEQRLLQANFESTPDLFGELNDAAAAFAQAVSQDSSAASVATAEKTFKAAAAIGSVTAAMSIISAVSNCWSTHINREKFNWDKAKADDVKKDTKAREHGITLPEGNDEDDMDGRSGGHSATVTIHMTKADLKKLLEQLVEEAVQKASAGAPSVPQGPKFPPPTINQHFERGVQEEYGQLCSSSESHTNHPYEVGATGTTDHPQQENAKYPARNESRSDGLRPLDPVYYRDRPPAPTRVQSPSGSSSWEYFDTDATSNIGLARIVAQSVDESGHGLREEAASARPPEVVETDLPISEQVLENHTMMFEDITAADSMKTAAVNVNSEIAPAEDLQQYEECDLDMYGDLADSEDKVHQAAQVKEPANTIDGPQDQDPDAESSGHEADQDVLSESHSQISSIISPGAENTPLPTPEFESLAFIDPVRTPDAMPIPTNPSLPTESTADSTSPRTPPLTATIRADMTGVPHVIDFNNLQDLRSMDWDRKAAQLSPDRSAEPRVAEYA